MDNAPTVEVTHRAFFLAEVENHGRMPGNQRLTTYVMPNGSTCVVVAHGALIGAMGRAVLEQYDKSREAADA
jgi:hypothetical protein